MNFLIVFTLTLLVLLCEGSQKKDGSVAGKDVLVIVQSSSNPSTNGSKIDPVSPNKVLEEPDLSSSESTPKVVRHLFSEKTLKRLKMNKIKKSWFSTKIAERPVIRILKTVPGKPDQVKPMGDLMRYAPRSLDTMGVGGLINYNNLERFYGNQPISPTSGSPNSLDHLFLPEFHVKDYMKPLEFNGIGNNFPSQEVTNAYADGYSYGSKPGDFRGHPLDVNFPTVQHHAGGGVPNIGTPGNHGHHGPSHGEPYNAPRGEFHLHSTSLPPNGDKSSEQSYQDHNNPEHGHGVAHGHGHQHVLGQGQGQRIEHVHEHGPPIPPIPHGIEQPQRPQNHPIREEHQHPDDVARNVENRNEKSSRDGPPGPDFSNEVEGDGGLWSIVHLAHMLQNTAGLQNSLGSLNGNNGEAAGPGDNQGNLNGNQFNSPDFDGKSPGRNHFDEPGPDGDRNVPNHSYEGPGGDDDGPPHNGQYDDNGPDGDRGNVPYNHFDKPISGHKGDSTHPNNFDKPITNTNRGNGQHNRFNTPSSHHSQGNKNSYHNRNQSPSGNRAQFTNHHYDGSSVSDAGQGPGNSFRDDHPNNYHDDFHSENHENPDNYNQRPNSPPSRPSQQYGNAGSGFDDEGSFYNSQEQYDGPRRPHSSNPGHGSEHGDDHDYDGFDK